MVTVSPLHRTAQRFTELSPCSNFAMCVMTDGTRILAHSNELCDTDTQCANNAIYCLPRLGSSVRIASPAAFSPRRRKPRFAEAFVFSGFGMSERRFCPERKRTATVSWSPPVSGSSRRLLMRRGGVPGPRRGVRRCGTARGRSGAGRLRRRASGWPPWSPPPSRRSAGSSGPSG